MRLNGIHHVTAVSAKIADNVKFYTKVLGLRLVKKSVNQDDVSAYHLFYADKVGTPGTDMTFFDWPHIAENIPGTDSIAGTAFRVNSLAALDFWRERLNRLKVQHDAIQEFNGRELLPFKDPEGQQLYLVNDRGADFKGEIWQQSDIPEEFLLKGFFSILLSVPDINRIASIFTQLLGIKEITKTSWIDKQSKAIVYSTSEETDPGTEIWLIEEPERKHARLGAGGTHHVAFRVKDFETQKQWHSHLSQSGLHVSALIDRFWFRSIYFRVTPGILFEIATDGPGFAIDEEPEKLGESLVLPPFFENRREEIEAGLTPIQV